MSGARERALSRKNYLLRLQVRLFVSRTDFGKATLLNLTWRKELGTERSDWSAVRPQSFRSCRLIDNKGAEEEKEWSLKLKYRSRRATKPNILRTEVDASLYATLKDANS